MSSAKNSPKTFSTYSRKQIKSNKNKKRDNNFWQKMLEPNRYLLRTGKQKVLHPLNHSTHTLIHLLPEKTIAIAKIFRYCKDVSEILRDISTDFGADLTEIFTSHLGPMDLEKSIADTYNPPSTRNRNILIGAGIATGVATTALAAEELMRRRSGDQTLIQNAIHHLPNIRRR